MEEWKPIIGYEGLYDISSFGRIKSLFFGKERILKPFNSGGYSRLNLYIDNNSNNFNIHRLVAIHFIQNPNNLPCVLHKIETLDENGMLYNGKDNLFWGTQKNNMQDKYKKGRANNHFYTKHPYKGKLGEKHFNSKKVYQYSLDKTFIKEWGGTREVERELGIANSSISNCCKGKYKSAGGFIWKYELLIDELSI